VASDLPSLREILDADTAVFFTPDDPISLARAIRMALEPERARGLVEECKKRIGVYSWDARAASALKGL
jgi:glycosyltransferase involved in cell wall biosynthesis